MITQEAINALKNDTYGIFIVTGLSFGDAMKSVEKIKKHIQNPTVSQLVIRFGAETSIDFISLEKVK